MSYQRDVLSKQPKQTNRRCAKSCTFFSTSIDPFSPTTPCFSRGFPPRRCCHSNNNFPSARDRRRRCNAAKSSIAAGDAADRSSTSSSTPRSQLDFLHTSTYLHIVFTPNELEGSPINST
eukprot:scaffold33389_cov91-Cyclotella_meneghiniana.AAC.8